MNINKIELLASEEASSILKNFLSSENIGYAVEYNGNGTVKGDFNSQFSHRGIYGFRVAKDAKSAIIYIGKAENDDRLRQHLQNLNKNGSPLASSVRNKHSKIKQFIAKGYTVTLCLCSNPNFKKASLSCIEIATALKAKEGFLVIFPKEIHWNERIG